LKISFRYAFSVVHDLKRRFNTESQHQEFPDRVKLLARVFATIAFQDVKHRAYDLQLDHWGICRGGEETFEEMRGRFEMDSGPVGKWLASNHNGFYDNSIEGVYELNMDADTTSSHVYYFSFSFHATTPFPTTWPPWTLNAVNSFPMPALATIRTVVSYIPLVNMSAWAINYLFGTLIKKLKWKLLSSIISIKDLVAWSTSSVAKPLLLSVGMNAKLPPPGEFLPRLDVLPLMMPTCYAMSGLDLLPSQRELLGDNLGDWHQNDGVVNTESMRGPCEDVVQPVSAFPLEGINSADARGVYWHMGTNDKMDHADEIGVFIDDDTVSFDPSC
jgi:hypothetical protein